MNNTERQAAVDDLLAVLQKPQRALDEAKKLAPALLGAAWNNADDDHRLMIAIQDLLGAEIASRRQALNLPPPANTVADLQWLRSQDRREQRTLLALTLVWACYVEQRKPADLTHDLHWSTRNIQLRISEGRAEIAQVIARRQVTPASPAVPGKSVISQPDLVTSAPDPQSRASVTNTAAPPAPSVMHQPVDRSSWNQIDGQNHQIIIGPVNAPISQPRTTEVHNHQHIYDSKQVSQRQGDTAPVGVGALLIMAAGYWLIQTAPWLSIGTVIAITLWRVLHHIVRLQQLFAWESSGDEQQWQAGYAAAWLGAAVWAVILALRIPFIFATPEYSVERLTLVLAFVSVCGYSFWLLNVDLLLWINDTAPDRLPWRWLRQRAQWLWDQRWMVLGLTWLMLVLFSFSLAMFASLAP